MANLKVRVHCTAHYVGLSSVQCMYHSQADLIWPHGAFKSCRTGHLSTVHKMLILEVQNPVEVQTYRMKRLYKKNSIFESQDPERNYGPLAVVQSTPKSLTPPNIYDL
jgi:hypothetical protein